MADLGIVTVPHPIGGIAEELVARKAIAAVDAGAGRAHRHRRAAARRSGTGRGGGKRVPATPRPDDLLDFQGS